MKKRVTIALAFFLLAVSAAGIAVNMEWRGMNPFRPVTVENATGASRTQEGGLLITDSSGERLILVNGEGKVEWIRLSSGKDGSKGFYSVSHTVSGRDGSLYLVDSVSEVNSWLSKEKVKRFSSDGKNGEVLYELEYENEVFAGRFKNLQQFQGHIYLMETTSRGLYVRDVESPEEARFFYYPEADRYIRKCLLHPADGTLYAMLQTGRLVTLAEDGTIETVYDRQMEKIKRIPWSFSFDQQGDVYLTDIWNREIGFLSDKSFVPLVFGGEQVKADFIPDWEDVKESDVYYQLEARDGLTTCTTDSVGWMEEDGTYVSRHEFPLTRKMAATGIMFWVMVVYSSSFLAVCVFYGIRQILTKGSRMAKISLAMVLITAGLTVIFSVIVLGNVQERLTNEMLKRASTMGEMIANKIPTEELLKIQGPEDYGSEAYEAVYKAVREDFVTTDGTLSDMYCVIYTLEEDVVVTRCILEEVNGCAYANEWDSYAEKDVLKSGISDYYAETGSYGAFVFDLSPIFDEEGNSVGLVEVGRDLNIIARENRQMVLEIYLNLVAVAAVSLMIGYELLVFWASRKEYEIQKKEKNNYKVPPNMLRIIVFLIFFTINIPTGFIAIYANQLAEGWEYLPIPGAVLAAVPISAEVLMGALLSVCGSFFIRKLGQWRAGVLGGVLFTAGLASRFLPNLWMLALGGALQGCGWGVILLIVNLMIAGMDTEEEREDGFSGYNIACQNGVNAGVVFGGFLMNWLSYPYVFLLSAAFGVVVIVLAADYFMTAHSAMEEEEEEVSHISLLQFLFAPRVLLYLVGILFPIVAGGYYLNYLHPMIGESIGLTETYISYSYLLNSLCILCLGNILTRVMSRRFGHRLSMVLASVICAGTFVMVGLFPSLLTLILALILLGISDSFGLSIQSAYFTRLPEVEAYGREKSMGISNLFDNLAETGGAFLFGYVLVIGLKEGLILIAVLVLLLALLFGIFGNIGRRTPLQKTEESMGDGEEA